MSLPNLWQILGSSYLLIEFIGIAAAVDAVLEARTAQGAIAWAVSLITFPLFSLPLYLVLGRSRFRGYVRARRAGNLEIQHIGTALQERYGDDPSIVADSPTAQLSSLQQLAQMPFLRGNEIRLLINGQATFEAIFEGIDRARDYILVQFYIVRDDHLGRRFKAHLLRKAKDGIRVYFLYDEVGSYLLPPSFRQELITAGVEIVPFHTTRGRTNRFQINFRNHRKVVIVDGKIGFLGGLNVGDEYLEGRGRLTPWRDTHCALRGPAVLGLQLAFIEDWHWATRRVPSLHWTPQPTLTSDIRVLVLPSGPADDLETCSLFFTQLIHASQRRLWIVTPYFVPDESVVSALQLAALRGVDVRIMLPGVADRRLVQLASVAYYEEISHAGIRLYRHQKGFCHQKVMLIDDDLATIGTANLDNRSFRLNFEATLLAHDKDFARQVERMLASDFADCKRLNPRQLSGGSLPFRIITRTARLLAPIL